MATTAVQVLTIPRGNLLGKAVTLPLKPPDQMVAKVRKCHKQETGGVRARIPRSQAELRERARNRKRAMSADSGLVLCPHHPCRPRVAARAPRPSR